MRDSQNTTVAEAPPPAPARLAYTRVNPLEHAEEIKQLFLANERAEFPAFFDRTYADAVADGATSWVGRDARGAICAHIAQFPRPFRLGTRVVRGSLLANLMVAKEHRTLWPALALVRQLVNDSRRSGSVDLLYGDPNDAALAILRAAGFRSVGALQRFVLPLADRRRPVDLGIRLYHLFGRLRANTTALVATARPASETPAGPASVRATDAGFLDPEPRPAVYRHRLAGYPSPSDSWYTFHLSSSSAAAVAAALVRGPVVCELRCERLTLVSSVLLVLGRALREAGVQRLELSVMGESRVAAEVRRAGFLPRQERIPVVAMPLTPPGTEAIESGAEWRLLPIDLDR